MSSPNPSAGELGQALGRETGGDRVREAYERGIRGMCSRFIAEDFVTRFSCHGCLCPGEGKEKGTPQAYLTEVCHYPDEPHSFGCLMLAEAHRNGITECREYSRKKRGKTA